MGNIRTLSTKNTSLYSTAFLLKNYVGLVSELFSHIYVVALKIVEGKQLKSPSTYRNNELVTYAEAKRLAESRPYIASVFSASSIESDVFVLGDGKNTSFSKERKRRSSTNEFYNGPLEGGTSYRIFQRVFVDDQVSADIQWGSKVRGQHTVKLVLGKFIIFGQSLEARRHIGYYS